jgi:hypothetical protein
VQVRDAVDRFLARVRQDTDVHLEALAADLLQIAQGDAPTSRADAERAAIEIARAVAKGGSHARHDLIARVVAAVRRLDDATTLRAILDALAEGAAGDASRVAVLVVDGETLRTHRHYGFPPGVAPGDLPLEASRTLVTAVRLRQGVSVGAADEIDSHSPAFMRVRTGHAGLVLPVVVERAVVALVWVEGPDRTGAEPGAPVWSDEVEVLVRHGSARLETVTSQRTVEVLTSPSG